MAKDKLVEHETNITHISNPIFMDFVQMVQFSAVNFHMNYDEGNINFIVIRKSRNIERQRLKKIIRADQIFLHFVIRYYNDNEDRYTWFHIVVFFKILVPSLECETIGRLSLWNSLS